MTDLSLPKPDPGWQDLKADCCVSTPTGRKAQSTRLPSPEGMLAAVCPEFHLLYTTSELPRPFPIPAPYFKGSAAAEMHYDGNTCLKLFWMKLQYFVF